MITTAEETKLFHEGNQRIAAASAISGRAIIQFAKLNDDFLDAVIRQLPQSGTYSKEFEWGTYKCCEHHAEKKFTGRQISAIERQFIAVVGENASTALLADEALWILLAAGDEPTGNGSPLTDGRLPSANAAATWASQEAKKKWEANYARMGELWAQANPMKPALAGFSGDTEWLNVLNRQGYELVRDKIKLDYLPQIKQLISMQAQDGVPWNQIASNLHKVMGKGKRWDWVRLVRTEFGQAIDKANMEQYAAMGVPFVQWSTSRSSGVCSICEGYSGNIYPVDDAPLKPHPQCRCLKTPVWGKQKIQVPRVAPVPIVPPLPKA